MNFAHDRWNQNGTATMCFTCGFLVNGPIQFCGHFFTRSPFAAHAFFFFTTDHVPSRLKLFSATQFVDNRFLRHFTHYGRRIMHHRFPIKCENVHRTPLYVFPLSTFQQINLRKWCTFMVNATWSLSTIYPNATQLYQWKPPHTHTHTHTPLIGVRG